MKLLKIAILFAAAAVIPAFATDSACTLAATPKGSSGSFNASSAATWSCSGEILSISINTPGASYTAGTYALTFSGACAATATYTVNTTTVSSVTLTYKGYSCPNTTTVSATGGCSGCTQATFNLTYTASISTVPGDGDTTCVGNDSGFTATPTLVIDTRIGTVAGGGLKGFCHSHYSVSGTGATPTGSGQVGITFASTGGNSKGTCANSFSAPSGIQPCPDASMFGWIVGTQDGVNVTLTPAASAILACSSVTAGNPTSLNCPNHGLSTGNVVVIDWATVGSWGNMNAVGYHVTVTDSNNFTVAFNSTGFVGTFDGTVRIPAMFLDTADESSPIFFTRNPPWAGGNVGGTTNITRKNVFINNLGSGSSDTVGVGNWLAGSLSTQFGSTFTFDNENLYFAKTQQEFNQAGQNAATVTFTWKANLTKNGANSGGAGATSNGLLVDLSWQHSPSVTDNVDLNPAGSGYPWGAVQSPTGMTFARNFARGNASFWRGIYNGHTNDPASGTAGNTFTDNAASNIFTSSNSFFGGNPLFENYAYTGDVGDVIDGLWADSGNQLLAVHNVASTHTSLKNFFANACDFASSTTQGVIEVYRGVLDMSNGVLVNSQANVSQIGVFAFGSTSTMLLDNVAVSTGGNGAGSIAFGEHLFPVVSSATRSSVITGNSNASGGGVWDCNACTGGADASTYLGDTVGANTVGVHHDDYFQNTNNIQPASPSGTNFQTGVTNHPNATYGDLTVSPQFVDVTRSLANFDTAIGGNGTADHFARWMACRTGWGPSDCPAFMLASGSITDGGYGAVAVNPLRAALDYFLQGWISQNTATWQTGWNGASVSSLPATCTPFAANDVVFLTVISSGNAPGPYRCTATNTWTAIATRDMGISRPTVQRMILAPLVF